MLELLTSRSRILNQQRCPRARYWLDEAFADASGQGGFSPAKVAIPLATGSAVHTGLESLMRCAQGGHVTPGELEVAVSLALESFRAECLDRKLDLDALESESFVFQEQMALTEALVRLAGSRVIPRLLELYEVLEVERMDAGQLLGPEPWDARRCEVCGWAMAPDRAAGCRPGDCSMRPRPKPTAREAHEDQFLVLFRSIPDAVVRSRADGDLYIISWKTASEYSSQRDQDARTDMQGLSEPWALEQRLRGWEKLVLDAVGRSAFADQAEIPAEIPDWFVKHLEAGGAVEIRGVQMIYLVKGQRRKQPDGTWRTQSPLIGGLRRDATAGLQAPEYATERFYVCPEPHPWKYAKGGNCPGGVSHRRGDDWQNFNAWEQHGGIAVHLTRLAGVPEGIAALDGSWVMPVPHYRTRAAVESWERQTRASESRHAQAIRFIREYESELREHPEDSELWAGWNRRLDELFPQSTERCGDWFHRRCPAWELCHGAPHVAQDPVGSGLFEIKRQYAPSEETVNG